MILIDSSVLIDVIEFDPRWNAWSSAQIEEAARIDQLAINEIVIAEVAPRSGPLAVFQAGIETMGIAFEPLSAEAAYNAGVAFQAYRKTRAKHPPTSILADFLIGGHAAMLGATILTRDPRFYRAYFPEVPLITPDTAP